MSKYAHQSAATTAMPSTAAMITGQVSGRPVMNPGPSPSEMIDSPSATRMISACRSAQCPAETSVHPLRRSSRPKPYSTAMATSHSVSRMPVPIGTSNSRGGSSGALTMSAVEISTGTASSNERRRSCGSYRTTQPKIATWNARTRK